MKRDSGCFCEVVAGIIGLKGGGHVGLEEGLAGTLDSALEWTQQGLLAFRWELSHQLQQAVALGLRRGPQPLRPLPRQLAELR